MYPETSKTLELAHLLPIEDYTVQILSKQVWASKTMKSYYSSEWRRQNNIRLCISAEIRN